MNERIRELKNLASAWCDENIPEQYSEEINGYGIVWEEKFAELIVRQCMNLVKDCYEEPVSEQSQYQTACASTIIEDYFGVEE